MHNAKCAMNNSWVVHCAWRSESLAIRVHCEFIMRILMLSWEYPPNVIGGMGTHVAELVPALAAQGAHVTLLTPRWQGGAEVERVSENAVAHRVTPPVPRPSNFYADVQQTNLTLESYASQLWEQGGGFDIIHAHEWSVSFAAEALKKLHKTPLIATIHATERGRGIGQLNDDMAQAINGAEWWLTYEAWRVILTSHFMAREVCAYFHLPDDKTVVIPNGVNPARFHPLTAEEAARSRLEWVLPHERLVFFIGRVQYEKGVHLLVDAAQRIVAGNPNVKFVIAGTGTMLNFLRQRVESFGMNDQILLPGYVSDETRDRLFQISDVAVFPSLYEPFGIVALEAMAAKCPVIASDAGGLDEVVEQGVTGIKIPRGNLDAIAQAIAQVLGDRDQAAARAARAFEVVSHEFSWSHIARATLELYQDIDAARRACDWN